MKLIEKARYFFAGMLIMVLLSTMVVPSLAASTARKITAYFNNIKLYVNDNLVVPKDGSGKTIEPFTYNGTTYLPVRALADALGQTVVWEGKTSSVYIGKHNSETPAANLIDMDYFYTNEPEGYGVVSYSGNIGATGEKDNIGNIHSKGLWLEVNFYNTSYHRVYLLNQKYSSFKGKIALQYDYKNATNGSGIKIYGDDKLLYSSPVMKAGSIPVDFDVDVSGVIQLKIEWYGADYTDKPALIFSGLDFYND